MTYIPYNLLETERGTAGNLQNGDRTAGTRRTWKKEEGNHESV